MKIAIGPDHAVFDYKERLKPFLLEKDRSVKDFGTHIKDYCDYPKFVRLIADAFASVEFDRGIVQ